MFCLLNPYRTNTNFSASKMEEATNVYEKLLNFVNEQKCAFEEEGNLRWSSSELEFWNRIVQTRKQMLDWLAEDVQTQGLSFFFVIVVFLLANIVSECVHELLRLVSYANNLSSPSARLLKARCAELVEWFFSLVGLSKGAQRDAGDKADRAAQAAVDIRAKLKAFGLTLPPPFKEQCFGISDWARDEALANAGIVVKDGAKSSTWKWKN